MTSTDLDALVASGSGPACMGEALRRRTHRVRAIVRGCRAPARVGEQLPVSLLGGDLLSLVSESLRRAIDLGSGAQFSQRAAMARRAIDDGTQRTPPPRTAHVTEGPERTPALREVVDESRIHRSTSRDRAFESDRVGDPARPLRSEIPSDWRPERRIDHANEATKLRNATETAGAHALRARASRSVLVERLKEYWRLQEAQQAASSAARAGNAAPSTAFASTASPSTQSPPMSLRAEAYSGLPFAAPRRTPTPDIGRRRTGTADVDDARYAPGNGIDYAGRMVAAADSRGDLAEQLADLLREQAEQHGIDVS